MCFLASRAVASWPAGLPRRRRTTDVRLPLASFRRKFWFLGLFPIRLGGTGLAPSHPSFGISGPFWILGLAPF
jgi:hypothetical protein